MVNAATEAAVSASISTPVGPVVAALLRIAMPLAVISVVTSMKLSGSGWHMGINSEVRFAAWIPANRATSRGLPFGLLGSAVITSADSATKAEASRRVGDLALTSTIFASPDSLKCESLLMKTSLNQEYGNEIACSEIVCIGWHDDEGICAGGVGEVA